MYDLQSPWKWQCYVSRLLRNACLIQFHGSHKQQQRLNKAIMNIPLSVNNNNITKFLVLDKNTRFIRNLVFLEKTRDSSVLGDNERR